MRRLLNLAVLLPVALSASDISAQARAEAHSHCFEGQIGYGDFQVTSAEAEVKCDVVGAYNIAGASVDAGKIGAFAGVNAAWVIDESTNNYIFAPQYAMTANSLGSWSDYLFWEATGAVPATAVFNLAVTGKMSIQGSEDLAVWPLASTWAFFDFSGWTSGGSSVSALGHWAFNNLERTDYPLDPFISFDLTNSSSLYFSYMLRAGAQINNPYGRTMSGSATSDFSHTAAIQGLQFLDADGNDVTSQVSYSFANGTEFYTPGTTVTPEPISMVLLGSGLLGLGALKMRRRRKEEGLV